MERPIPHKNYIYYLIRALCIRTWGIYSRVHNIYEFEKCYYYQGIDEGYRVNSYTLPILNQEGVRCNIVLDKDCFDKYFMEIPGTYIETT